jgi:hypothetical protein
MGCHQSQITPVILVDETSCYEQNSSRNNQKVEKFLKTAYLKLDRVQSIKLLLGGSKGSRDNLMTFLRDDYYGKNNLAKFEEVIKHFNHLVSFDNQDERTGPDFMTPKDPNKGSGKRTKNVINKKVITKDQIRHIRADQRTNELVVKLSHRAFPAYLQSAAHKRWRAYELGALSSIRATVSAHNYLDCELNDQIICNHNTCTNSGKEASPECSKEHLYNTWVGGTAASVRNSAKASFAEKAFSMSILKENSALLTSSSWLAQLVAGVESLPLSFWLIANDDNRSGSCVDLPTSRRSGSLLSYRSQDISSVTDLTATADGSVIQTFAVGAVGRPHNTVPVVMGAINDVPVTEKPVIEGKDSRQSRIVYVNQKFESDFGHSRDRVNGTDVDSILMDAAVANDQQLITQSLIFSQALTKGHATGEFDVFIRRRDDTFARTYIVTRSLRDQNDNYRYMMCLSVCGSSFPASDMDGLLRDFHSKEFTQPVLKYLIGLLPTVIIDSDSMDEMIKIR